MTEPINTAVAGVSLVTLAVAFFGPQAGPYIVVVLGSLGGSLWALSSAVLSGRLAGLWLMIRCVMTAIVLTSIIAGFVGPWIGLQVVEVYAVVSFIIGALGNKWIELIEALKTRLIGAIDTGGKP